MNTLAADREKEIFECYKNGTHRIIITRTYKISSRQFRQIIKNHLHKEYTKKQSLKK